MKGGEEWRRVNNGGHGSRDFRIYWTRIEAGPDKTGHVPDSARELSNEITRNDRVSVEKWSPENEAPARQ